MILNGGAYSSILKYDPLPALRAVEHGALGAGLSGTGPAVAAVFDPSKQAEMDELAEDWAAGRQRCDRDRDQQRAREAALTVG